MKLTPEQAHQMARSVTTAHVVLIGDARVNEEVANATVLLAEALQHERHSPLVLVESSAGFTQRLRPSTILVTGMPEGVIATFAVLDQQGIPARLCSPLDLPGCHDGSALELARAWLAALDPALHQDVTLLTCGSAALHEQVIALAHELGMPCMAYHAVPDI